MPYERIRPFPDPRGSEFPELAALAALWKEKKAALENDGAYLEFIKRLQREWAIETGIIERLYTWDRGVTEVLIEQGIEASIISHHGGVSQQEAEHIRAMINDHLGIVEGLFQYVKGEAPLTEAFIRYLQAQFTANQEYVDAVTESGVPLRVQIVKGQYKELPNNPRRPDGQTHVYCPPGALTKEEMENLVRLYVEAEPLYPPEVRAAWLHHRFTQIHPFQDGNGRVARALASLVFLREGLFPLVVRDSQRKEYIDALEQADTGDLSPLTAFMARRQRDAILKALGLEQQVQQSKHSDQILSSAIELLKAKYAREKQKVSKVFDDADQLITLVEGKFRGVVASLDKELRGVTPPQADPYRAWLSSARNNSEQRHYFYKEIIDTAKRFDYFANFEQYRAWVRIRIATEHEFDYVVSFHGFGPSDNGILAISAFTYMRTKGEGGFSETVNLHPATIDLFQANYVEPFESTRKRFDEWIEGSLAIALAEWKRSLA